MKGRSTGVLLAGIVLLGTFIWLQERWLASVPPKQFRDIKLFGIDPPTLATLQFASSTGLVECVLENGVWHVGGADGSRGRADVAQVSRLVAGLNSLGKGTTITAKHLAIRGLDPAEYGFDEPAVRIVAVDGQGRREWLVGRKTPLGDMVYVMVEGKEEIHTVADKILALVPSQAGQLRDRAVFAGEAAGVRRVEIRGSGGFVQLLRDAQAGWRIVQPVDELADAGEVQSYIEKLQRLRVADFVADHVADFSIYGLQGETRQILLGGAGDASRVLALGEAIPSREGFVYARRTDDTSVFALPSGVLELLDVPSDRFRDARVLMLPPEAVCSVSIARGGDRIDLARDGGRNWALVNPMSCAADQAVVDTMVRLWSQAAIIGFNVGADPLPADWIFAFGSVAQGKTNRIEVLPSFGKRDGLLVRKDGEPALHRINLPGLPASFADPLAYKSRHPWRSPNAQVRSISLVRRGTPAQTVERGENGGGFVPIGTNGNARANAEHAERLAARMASLATTGYVAHNPDDLEAYGLADPWMELRIGFAGTNEIGRILLVGDETPEGFYSMAKGRDVVFYLDKAVVGELAADLVTGPEPSAPAGE